MEKRRAFRCEEYRVPEVVSFLLVEGIVAVDVARWWDRSRRSGALERGIGRARASPELSRAGQSCMALRALCVLFRSFRHIESRARMRMFVPFALLLPAQLHVFAKEKPRFQIPIRRKSRSTTLVRAWPYTSVFSARQRIRACFTRLGRERRYAYCPRGPTRIASFAIAKFSWAKESFRSIYPLGAFGRFR